MYFRLNPECYFIKGKKHGAIFDIINGEIFALNLEETETVMSCEKNNPILENTNFLYELKQLCLGNFYQNKVYMHKLRVDSPVENDEMTKPPEIFRAFLEINNECNNKCWFCGFNGIKRSLGCLGCNVWDESGGSLTLDRWSEIIEELRYLNCQEIFISGGDLTIEWDRTKEILNYLDKKFKKVYITLHKRNLSENILKDLKNKANIIIQTDELNDIRSNDFNYLLVSKTKDFNNNKIKSQNVILDFVIDNENPLSYQPYQKAFPSINIYQFINNIEYHPCLGHTLTVCYNGNVIPCPMMRHSVLGNLTDKPLYNIFKEKKNEIDRFWKLNLDKIEKCTDCEFRYVCTDCRALEENITGRWNGKTFCGYNPEEGEWL